MVRVNFYLSTSNPVVLLEMSQEHILDQVSGRGLFWSAWGLLTLDVIVQPFADGKGTYFSGCFTAGWDMVMRAQEG